MSSAPEPCPSCRRPLQEPWWSCRHCGQVLRDRVAYSVILSVLLLSASAFLAPLIAKQLLQHLVRGAGLVLGIGGLIGMIADVIGTRRLRLR